MHAVAFVLVCVQTLPALQHFVTLRTLELSIDILSPNIDILSPNIDVLSLVFTPKFHVTVHIMFQSEVAVQYMHWNDMNDNTSHHNLKL